MDADQQFRDDEWKQLMDADRTGGGSKGSKRVPLLSAPATLAELGLDKKTSAIAQQLAALPTVTRGST